MNFFKLSNVYYTMTEDTKYYQARITELGMTEEHSEDGFSYPHVFSSEHPRITIADFIKAHSDIEPSQDRKDHNYSLVGRTHTQRKAGKHIMFMDLNGEADKLQVMAWDKHYHDPSTFTTELSKISRGDYIGIDGYPYKTEKGELSIMATRVVLLAPCLHQIPKKFNKRSEGEISLAKKDMHSCFGFSDKEKRFRERYLDMIINTESIKIFKTRSLFIQGLRSYLVGKRFLEIETPILNTIMSGANATPFMTHHNDLNIDMCLRVAPELFLKMAVVGGFDRVFEIGRVFRNEGIDHTHNPEFTVVELYQADADHETLMGMMEDMIPTLVHQATGATEVEFQGQTIDWNGPYPRIDIMTFLTEKFPEFPKLDSPTLQEDLMKFCLEKQVSMPSVSTPAKLFDKIIGHFIEPLCQNPTFICGHPILMSPLAKPHRSRPHITERFELFVAGREIANGFTELNDPRIQLQNFEDQVRQKAMGDSEAQEIDTNFVKALEIGLPPTAGLGIGLDRMVMLLTNQEDIREVIMFPTMKVEVPPEVDTEKKAKKQKEKYVRPGEEGLTRSQRKAKRRAEREAEKAARESQKDEVKTDETSETV